MGKRSRSSRETSFKPCWRDKAAMRTLMLSATVPCGAILGIDARPHVGEDFLEAIIGCARCRLAFEHDLAVVASTSLKVASS